MKTFLFALFFVCLLHHVFSSKSDVTDLCKDVKCKDRPICHGGRILHRNPAKCRCCDVCALRDDETEDDSRCTN